MNEALGGRGATYTVIDPVEADPVDHGASMRGLMEDMRAGRVNALLVIDSNPVLTAPGFADALQRVPFAMTLAAGPSETAGKTQWSLPGRHAFEDWSDARAFDGTLTIMQPQAQPLYEGISPHTLLALLAGPEELDSRAIVRQTHGFSDEQWHDALASGVVADTQAAASAATIHQAASPAAGPAEDAGTEVTLLVRPDPHIWDGRFANNAWLQELPRPLTKLTWDNPLLVSPAIAKRLSLVNGDNVSVSVGDAGAHAAGLGDARSGSRLAVALLGSGRWDAGMVGQGVGWIYIL